MFKLFKNRKKMDRELFDRIVYKCRLSLTPHLIERRPNRYVSKIVGNPGLQEKLHAATEKAA